MLLLIQKVKIYLSFISIIYVWILPYLSNIGFAEKNGTSISEFIANPQATGAMAAFTFLPIILMNEYQDLYIDNKNILNITLLFFEISYGMFLSCPITYVSKFVHEFFVICFGISFIIHSYFILYHEQFNKITKFVLGIGNLCFILLLSLNSNCIIYWFIECICFTCMILFTPIDWYLLSIQEKKSQKSLLNI